MFAGEWLSDAWPGYMNGAVQTGRIAAEAALAPAAALAWPSQLSGVPRDARSGALRISPSLNENLFLYQRLRCSGCAETRDWAANVE